MSKRQSRYKQMEWYMTYALVADLGLFILYLIFAAYGIVWLEAILAILTALLSLGCLGFLYLSRELLRQRSFWMTVGAGAIAVCLLFSLLLNYPRPAPTPVAPYTPSSQTE